MTPGTWLKHYVTDQRKLPIYFRFIGRILMEKDNVEFVVLDAIWGQRLLVNEEFVSHLLALEEDDNPEVIIKKLRVQTGNNRLTVKDGGEIAPASLAANQKFPRFFGLAGN